jgi:hypothetical protein
MRWFARERMQRRKMRVGAAIQGDHRAVGHQIGERAHHHLRTQRRARRRFDRVEQLVPIADAPLRFG